METFARAKMLRMSARKVRLVLAAVRGKKATDALSLLSFMPLAAAKPVYKLLQSAVANAENNHSVTAEKLWISRAVADNAGFLKRFRPRAMGKAGEIHKHFAHLEITLADVAPRRVKK